MLQGKELYNSNTSKPNEPLYNDSLNINGGIRQRLFQMQKSQNPLPNSTVKHSQFIDNASTAIVKPQEPKIYPVRQPLLIPNLNLSNIKVTEPHPNERTKQLESSRVPHKLLLQVPPTSPYHNASALPELKMRNYPHSQNQEQRSKNNLGFTFV